METWVVPNMGSDSYLELSTKNQTKRKVLGRLFRKQILHEGSFIHPNNPAKKVVIDKEFAENLVKNFNEGTDIVQFPIVDGDNKHSEDPTRNIGEVVGLSYKPGVGVFADIDVRKNADDVGTTIIGGSAMISTHYRDNVTGDYRSPVLLHIAATNRPFISGLEPFQELVSLSDTTEKEVVLLSEEDNEGTITPIAADKITFSEHNTTGGKLAMSKDELIAALKEHGVDVMDLQRRVAAVEDIAAFSNIVDTKDSKLTLSDLAEATLELDEKNIALSEQVETLTKDKTDLEDKYNALLLTQAEAEVDTLIADGKIFPKARDKMIELSMKDRETFEALVPDEPIVKLSDSQTVTTFTDGEDAKNSEDIAEIERYLTSVQSK